MINQPKTNQAINEMFVKYHLPFVTCSMNANLTNKLDRK